jgi:hypothetical protein
LDEDLLLESSVSASVGAQVIFSAIMDVAEPALTGVAGLHVCRQLLHDYRELKIEYIKKKRNQLKQAYVKLYMAATNEGREPPPEPDYDAQLSFEPHWSIVRVRRLADVVVNLVDELLRVHARVSTLEGDATFVEAQDGRSRTSDAAVHPTSDEGEGTLVHVPTGLQTMDAVYMGTGARLARASAVANAVFQGFMTT